MAALHIHIQVPELAIDNLKRHFHDKNFPKCLSSMPKSNSGTFFFENTTIIQSSDHIIPGVEVLEQNSSQIIHT